MGVSWHALEQDVAERIRRAKEKVVLKLQEKLRKAQEELRRAEEIVHAYDTLHVNITRNGKPPYLRRPWGARTDPKSLIANEKARERRRLAKDWG